MVRRVYAFHRGHRHDLRPLRQRRPGRDQQAPGVTGVEVDVAAGTVRISGDPLPGDAPLREAVEEAGYEFAG